MRFANPERSSLADQAGFLDSAYTDCEILKSSDDVLAKTDVFVCVAPPTETQISKMKNDSVLVGMVAPFADKQRFDLANKKNITLFSMELVSGPGSRLHTL